MSRGRCATAGVVIVLMIAGIAGWNGSDSAFKSTTSNSVNGFGVAANFVTGPLYTWGSQTNHTTSPTQVGAVSTWNGADNGAEFSCATRTDGTMWCWGVNNNSGRLGQNDTANYPSPTKIVGATTWTSVSLGLTHACGLRSDGTLWCWGDNGDGQLGLGTAATESRVPAQVTSPATTGWSSLATGAYDTCAVRTGALYCWGNNSFGQLGLNDQTKRTSPTQVTSPSSSGWVQPALGYGHSCAIRTGATLYCWGNGGSGKLGNGASTSSNVAVAVTGTTWTAVAAGTDHACALKSTNTLWCWGVGGNGRLGLNSTTDALSPTQVGSATNWSQISLGSKHSCGTHTDKTTWCWGSNAYGQLGIGNTTDQLLPAQVVSMTGRSVNLGPASDTTTFITG